MSAKACDGLRRLHESFGAGIKQVMLLVAELDNKRARTVTRVVDDQQFDLEREAEQQRVNVSDLLSDGLRSAG